MCADSLRSLCSEPWCYTGVSQLCSGDSTRTHSYERQGWNGLIRWCWDNPKLCQGRDLGRNVHGFRVLSGHTARTKTIMHECLPSPSRFRPRTFVIWNMCTNDVNQNCTLPRRGRGNHTDVQILKKCMGVWDRSVAESPKESKDTLKQSRGISGHARTSPKKSMDTPKTVPRNVRAFVYQLYATYLCVATMFLNTSSIPFTSCMPLILALPRNF